MLHCNMTVLNKRHHMSAVDITLFGITHKFQRVIMHKQRLLASRYSCEGSHMQSLRHFATNINVMFICFNNKGTNNASAASLSSISLKTLQIISLLSLIHDAICQNVQICITITHFTRKLFSPCYWMFV